MPRKSTDSDYVNKVSPSNPSKDPPPPVQTVKDFQRLEVPERVSSPNNLIWEETVDPVALFERFFDTQVIESLVKCTNDNASRFIAQQGDQFNPKNHRPWSPVTINEMYAYLGRDLISNLLVNCLI